jgi:hypothetical protein
MTHARFVLICAATMAFATPASARFVDEARVGVAAHNVRFGGEDASDDPGDPRQSNESGPDLELEIVSSQLHLGMLGAPRPYAMLSANLNGDTSYAAVGLAWRWRFARHWTLEPSLGVAVHDGATHNPYASGDPRAAAYARDHQLLGTRVVFRETLGVDRDLDDRHALGLVFEHLSNGGALFGHDDNQSLNEIAVRFTVRR